jgi:hypothetical protein
MLHTSKNQLIEDIWPILVIRHTKNGSCNFQAAANDLAQIVREDEQNKFQSHLLDLFCSAKPDRLLPDPPPGPPTKKLN